MPTMTDEQLRLAMDAYERIKDAHSWVIAIWPNSMARKRVELDHEQACADLRAVLDEVGKPAPVGGHTAGCSCLSCAAWR